MHEPALTLTVLCEDAECPPPLRRVHGLSFLVEMPQCRVLLDAGPDDTAIHNADSLGVSLQALNALVFSHGHYDHTGGLRPVLARAAPLRVVGHPAVLRRRFAVRKDGSLRDAGPPGNAAALRAWGAELDLTPAPVYLSANLLTTGAVPELFADRKAGSLRTEIDGRVVPDDFADDLSLVAQLADGIVIITGCAHAGLRNIVRHAVDLTGADRVHAIVGGTHMVALDATQIERLAAWLLASHVEALAPCHCTGREATAQLHASFNGAVAPIRTGDRVTFTSAGRMTVN